MLWERCHKAMKNKIEARSDYNRIKNNPITLLMAIKEHALNFQGNRYSMSIILDATLLFTKKKEGESLQDYTKRFRVASHTLEDPLSSTSSLKPSMGTTRPTSSYKINFVNKHSVNLWPIYTLIMRVKPNKDQL